MRVHPWNDMMQHAMTEVQARITAVYPEATFRLVEGEDPTGLSLDAYTDAEDAFAVLDLVSDWLVDLSVNAGVHLMSFRCPERPQDHMRSPTPPEEVPLTPHMPTMADTLSLPRRGISSLEKERMRHRWRTNPRSGALRFVGKRRTLGIEVTHRPWRRLACTHGSRRRHLGRSS